MINALNICDCNDDELGSFFRQCVDRTREIFNGSERDFNIDEVSGGTLFDIVVPIKARLYNEAPFFFTSYSHGSKTELLQNGNTPFISEEIANDCLRNSFSYCFACEAGAVLGNILCEQEALSFIGYNNVVKIQKYFGAELSFVDCAVSGIQRFVEGGTTGETLKSMKDKYTECMDEFYKIDMIVSTFFMDNRDALILHGNKDLTINDF